MVDLKHHLVLNPFLSSFNVFNLDVTVMQFKYDFDGELWWNKDTTEEVTSFIACLFYCNNNRAGTGIQ